MIKAFYNKLIRKALRSEAQQKHKECRKMSDNPQFKHATRLSNELRLQMVHPKSTLLMDRVFRNNWNTLRANEYELATQGASLFELVIAIERLTILLDADYVLSKDDIHTTPKDVSLGTYLTHHDGGFTDPYMAMIAFKQASVGFATALQFYTERHPDSAQYLLRILSGYTESINAVLDDLIELQCDFLSP